MKRNRHPSEVVFLCEYGLFLSNYFHLDYRNILLGKASAAPPCACWNHLHFVVLIFTAVKKLKPCGIHFNFVDFCHDSAKYASIMALAAPKVHQYFTLIFVLIKGAGR